MPVFSQTAIEREPRSESQFRGEVEVVVPANKRLFFVFSTDLRAAQVAENQFIRYEAGLFYRQKLNKFLNVVPRYRYRSTQEFAGTSETENRLSLDAIVNFKIGNFEITDNNLFEFRFRRANNTQRYRNRLQIEHPIAIGKTKFSLFASNEVYYERQRRAFTRNRFRIGFAQNLTERAAYEVYYLRQNDGFSRPGDLHVFGIEFEFEMKQLFGK